MSDMQTDLDLATGFGISKEDATKRAIEDYSQFSQHTRAFAQYVFAANAGASAAMLSYMTAIATSSKTETAVYLHRLIRYLACACSFYLIGVFFIMLYLLMMSAAKQKWGHFWEEMANTTHSDQFVQADFSNLFAKSAERFDSISFKLMIIAAVCFLPGSIFAVLGFLTSN